MARTRPPARPRRARRATPHDPRARSRHRAARGRRRRRPAGARARRSTGAAAQPRAMASGRASSEVAGPIRRHRLAGQRDRVRRGEGLRRSARRPPGARTGVPGCRCASSAPRMRSRRPGRPSRPSPRCDCELLAIAAPPRGRIERDQRGARPPPRHARRPVRLGPVERRSHAAVRDAWRDHARLAEGDRQRAQRDLRPCRSSARRSRRPPPPGGPCPRGAGPKAARRLDARGDRSATGGTDSGTRSPRCTGSGGSRGAGRPATGRARSGALSPLGSTPGRNPCRRSGRRHDERARLLDVCREALAERQARGTTRRCRRASRPRPRVAGPADRRPQEADGADRRPRRATGRRRRRAIVGAACGGSSPRPAPPGEPAGQPSVIGPSSRLIRGIAGWT